MAYSTFNAFNGIFKCVNISVKQARHLFFVNIDAKVSQIFCIIQMQNNISVLCTFLHIEQALLALRRHRNCPGRRRGVVAPHWHV